MNWNSWITQHILVFICFKESYSFDFEISVPRTPPLAIHGHQVVLDCSFPVDNTWDLGSTVITWQRGQEVVHSFYHGRDQLDRQGRRYANRTSLFHSEIKRGNASLKLERTNLGDRGDYTCSVSTLLGNQRKTFPLKLAAFFPEPRLHLKASPRGMELLLTSHGGYPEPTVQWLDDSGDDITNDTNTHYSQDTQGLYALFSSLSLPGAVNRTVSFLLENKDLGAVIRREYTLQTEIDLESSEDHHDRHRWCVSLSIITLLMVILVAVLLSKRTCLHNRSQEINCREKGNYTNANGNSVQDSQD